jgi:carbon storage regulator
MLILSRNFGQTIKIGDDIDIKIIRGKYNEARIGINAPKEIKVLREELINKDIDEPSIKSVKQEQTYT